jgi:hypothetical protein
MSKQTRRGDMPPGVFELYYAALRGLAIGRLTVTVRDRNINAGTLVVGSPAAITGIVSR